MTIDDINPKKLKSILDALERGMYERDAAAIGGVSERTYYRWKREIPEFEQKVTVSILKYKRSLIMAVHASALKNGSMALKILKTRYPKEWNVKYNRN